MHSDPLARLGSRECGGQNLYVKSLIQNLDSKGWFVDAFTRLNDRGKKIVSRIGNRSRVVRLIGGPASHVPKGKLHPLFPHMYRNFKNFVNGSANYDIFHGHHYDGGWMAARASTEYNKPLFTTFHSLGKIRFQTQKNYLGKTEEEEILNERFQIESEIIKKSSAIIELSESEKKGLVDFYGASAEKVHVIPGGVNLKQFENIAKEKARELINIPKENFTVLFVGRLEWRKGVSTLLHAMTLLKDRIPNLNSIIVGGKFFGRNFDLDDKNEYERLLKIAKGNGLENFVRFTGSVSHTDLPKYYSAADVLVIPSYYEPFGLVALEGLASKIPVIASRVGGLQITIKDGINGLLFEPRNPADLSEKILNIYNSKDKADKFSKAGYEEVSRCYSWSCIVDKVISTYESFIKSDEIEESKDENSASISI
jgi:D-inositol-3-phosphate glycosyltransferase